VKILENINIQDLYIYLMKKFRIPVE